METSANFDFAFKSDTSKAENEEALGNPFHKARKNHSVCSVKLSRKIVS